MHGKKKSGLGDFRNRATTKTYHIEKIGRRNFENLEFVITGVGYDLSIYTQPSSSDEETMRT